jgi:hypothetical protein
LEAKGDEASLDVATEMSCGWLQLEGLVATAAELTNTMSADPMVHVAQGYHRFRRYAPRMLRALDIHGPLWRGPWSKRHRSLLMMGMANLNPQAFYGVVPNGAATLTLRRPMIIGSGRWPFCPISAKRFDRVISGWLIRGVTAI